MHQSFCPTKDDPPKIWSQWLTVKYDIKIWIFLKDSNLIIRKEESNSIPIKYILCDIVIRVIYLIFFHQIKSTNTCYKTLMFFLKNFDEKNCNHIIFKMLRCVSLKVDGVSFHYLEAPYIYILSMEIIFFKMLRSLYWYSETNEDLNPKHLLNAYENWCF